VLSYIQKGVAEAWKDKLLDKLAKRVSEIEAMKELFKKIRDKFRETTEEKKKVEQLRTIEQGGRFYDKYVQEFKKVTRESGYEGRPLIEEFKRKLNRTIRRKLVETESLPTTIEEWQERVVRLDRNQRQSRAEERLLGRNVAYPGRNVQPRNGGYGGGSYGEREGQIMWRAGNSEGYRRGEQSTPNQRNQICLRRDLDAIDVDKEKGGDRTSYVCGK